MRCAIALVLGVATVALGASVKSGGVSPHIIGGNREDFHNVPYAIKLKMRTGDLGGPDQYRYCGAARLDRNWFVTAAECLDNSKYEYVYINYPVEAGSKNQFKTERVNIKYTDPVLHPEYNNVSKANNIGLIHCDYWCEDITDKNLLPVLPKKGESFSSAKPVVTGWTITDSKDEAEDEEITSYETALVNSFLCKLVYFFRSVTSDHICASTWGGKRLTEAHVGVPLVTKEDSRLKLIGIASSVRPWTTKLPVPTVFTNIAQYAEWISKVTDIPIGN